MEFQQKEIELEDRLENVGIQWFRDKTSGYIDGTTI